MGNFRHSTITLTVTVSEACTVTVYVLTSTDVELSKLMLLVSSESPIRICCPTADQITPAVCSMFCSPIAHKTLNTMNKRPGALPNQLQQTWPSIVNILVPLDSPTVIAPPVIVSSVVGRNSTLAPLTTVLAADTDNSGVDSVTFLLPTSDSSCVLSDNRVPMARVPTYRHGQQANQTDCENHQV